MVKTLSTAALVACALLLGFGYVRLEEAKGHALRKGQAAPAYEALDLAGAPVSLASLRGKVVVLNFWASWCEPCVREMPSLDRLHRALASEGLVVLGVSADEDRLALDSFLRRAGVSFPVWRDPGGQRAEAQYHVTGYPETFVIDRSGVLRESYVGPAEWDTPAALAHFRTLLRP